LGGGSQPRTRSAHTIRSGTGPVRRFDLPYLLVGVGTAAGRRAQSTLATGARIGAAVTAPAVAAFEATPLAAPVRRRTAAVADPLVADGRAVVELARQTVEQAVGRVTSDALDSRALDAAVDRVLSSGAARRVVTVVINHPATDELLTNALDGPGIDRVVARVMDSRLLDQLTSRVLESDEFRQVLRYITSSPELRAALSQQTAGFAEDVTVGVRSRTVTADDAVEKAARSLLRRPRRVQPD
jgi:hypothetical protein